MSQVYVSFPALRKTFPSSPTLILGRHIQISNLLMGVKVAYRDFHGKEEGDKLFEEAEVQIPNGELSAVFGFGASEDEPGEVVYPISMLFQNAQELNSLTRNMAELMCGMRMGYAPQLMKDSSTQKEGYCPYEPPERDKQIDLLTILALESIRDNTRMTQRGLHLFVGELTSQILQRQKSIYWSESIVKRLNDMPSGFYHGSRILLH